MRKTEATDTDDVQDQEVLVLCELALAIAEPERERFLASACADNPALRASIDQLLNAVDESGSFLQMGDDS